MRGCALQRLMVLHQAFHSIGCLGAGKLFLVGFPPAHHRDGEDILKKVGVAVQLLFRLGLRLFSGFMDRVTFLPPEFPGAQERTRGLLPTDDGAPLVIQHGELAV